MFGFLKKKLRETVERFSKKTEEEGKEVPKEEIKEILIEKSVEISEEKEEIEIKEEKKEELKLEYKKGKKKEEAEKKGFFAKVKEKILTRKLNDGEFDEFFSDLELVLLENNVAVEVVDKIKEDLKMDLVNVPLKRNEIEKIIDNSLRESIDEILSFKNIDLIKNIDGKQEKPFVICFLGQNGSGKTTSIAKVAYYLKKHKKSVVFAASDTFRAGSIQQLQEWGDRLNVKVIAKDYKADPSSVAFDAIKFSQAHNIDTVLIDTAGRQHSNQNLMEEVRKIIRVTKPDLKIFVGEALTGNDSVLQAQTFNKIVGIDGIILTKADVDEKGGAVVSMSYITKKPIIFLGVGQSLSDLKEFNKVEILKNIGF
ncbi:signal recognition particle-docking protein FtsY [Candidatus Woesearchaeota archaeon]|nr:signal recognition particle-docking protein FtsY [Candidatus Woesearchaeota archaeon]